MRHLVLLALSVACTGTVVPPEAPSLTFERTPTQWALTPVDGGKTHLVLDLGSSTMDFGTVEGRCVPTAELPFTEVQGQKSFAALLCDSPDGGTHHVVVLEVQSAEDPDWPQPVALAVVLARTSADNKVGLLTLGAVEVPLGVVPVAPVLPVPEAKPADPL